jgi:hypothetical protein
LKEFDLTRAVFWLIAGVIGFQSLLVLIAVGTCAYHSIVTERIGDCKDIGIAEIMTATLGASMALLGVNRTNK